MTLENIPNHIRHSTQIYLSAKPSWNPLTRDHRSYIARQSPAGNRQVPYHPWTPIPVRFLLSRSLSQLKLTYSCPLHTHLTSVPALLGHHLWSPIDFFCICLCAKPPTSEQTLNSTTPALSHSVTCTFVYFYVKCLCYLPVNVSN